MLVLSPLARWLRDQARRVSSALAGALPSGILLVSVIVLDVVLLMTVIIATQYFGFDSLTGLLFVGADGSWSADRADFCDLRTSAFGVHCFGDFGLTAIFATSPNPWEPRLGHNFNYTAAGMLPHLFFGLIGLLVGRPIVGAILFVIALMIGFIVPALWASKGRSVAARVGIAAGLGLVSIPALQTLDRANSVGFIAPVLLVLFIALARGRRGLVVAMIIVAAMIKPQFALLAVIPFAQRRWRDGGLSILGILVTNVLAYLAWPRDFPSTIRKSISNTLDYGSAFSLEDEFPPNVSFARGLYAVEMLARQLLGLNPDSSVVDRWQGIVGPAIALLVAAAVVVLGRRLPPVLAAIVIVAAASLVTSVSFAYYLSFVVAVAAVLLRDPGRGDQEPVMGLLDSTWRETAWKTVAALALVAATAASLTRVMWLTEPVEYGEFVVPRTNADWIPVLWLAAIATTMIAWGRRRREPVEV